MKTALVTIVLGKHYEDLFNEYAIDNWKLYCKKFNFELIVIKESLDTSDRGSKRSAAWQKLLILSQSWSADYDRIIWVDADIIINVNTATDITDNIPLDKIGAVEGFSIPSREFHHIGLKRSFADWRKNNIPFLDNTTPALYYTNRGINGGNLKYLMQTGVFVCSPKHHKAIFEKVYYNYEDTKGAEWNYEMPALSYELVKADLVEWISPRFNFIASIAIKVFYYDMITNQKRSLTESILKVTNKLLGKPAPQKENILEIKILKNIYELSMFMHFAGCSHLMPKMKSIINK
jgi:hypothetical protein